jgi:hypothetical protein
MSEVDWLAATVRLAAFSGRAGASALSRLVLRGWLGLCVEHGPDRFPLTPDGTDAIKPTDA